MDGPRTSTEVSEFGHGAHVLADEMQSATSESNSSSDVNIQTVKLLPAALAQRSYADVVNNKGVIKTHPASASDTNEIAQSRMQGYPDQAKKAVDKNRRAVGSTTESILPTSESDKSYYVTWEPLPALPGLTEFGYGAHGHGDEMQAASSESDGSSDVNLQTRELLPAAVAKRSYADVVNNRGVSKTRPASASDTNEIALSSMHGYPDQANKAVDKSSGEVGSTTQSIVQTVCSISSPRISKLASLILDRGYIVMIRYTRDGVKFENMQ